MNEPSTSKERMSPFVEGCKAVTQELTNLEQALVEHEQILQPSLIGAPPTGEKMGEEPTDNASAIVENLRSFEGRIRSVRLQLVLLTGRCQL